MILHETCPEGRSYARSSAICNDLATTAGINTDTNDGFVAWLSAPGSLALSRIDPSVGGFERMDGFPFVLTRAGLSSNQIVLALYVDEQGDHQSGDIASNVAWTGTHSDGGLAATHCNGWNSTSGFGQIGKVAGGPGFWTESNAAACSGMARLYCLQIDSTASCVVRASRSFTGTVESVDDELPASRRNDERFG